MRYNQNVGIGSKTVYYRTDGTGRGKINTQKYKNS